MKPRFTPIVERPAGYEREIRRRRQVAKTAALHARLAREVQEQKGQSNVRRDA